MVQPVNGKNGDTTPAGYTKIKMYDEQSKKTETYFVPIGKKVTVNGKTFDPSKGKNNEIVFTGKQGQAGFDMMGLALEHMDVNKDGKIDKNDTDFDLANKVNKDLKKKDMPYAVRGGEMSDAAVSKGEGGVTFRGKNEPLDVKLNIELGDD